MRALFLHADFDPKPGYVLDEDEKATNKIKMSNMVWRNPRLELVDVPEPMELGPRDVKIHVKAAGICGSDLHYVEHDEEGYILFPGRTRLNIVTGHEFCGIVAEVGKDVTEFKPGDLVVPEEMIWCGECVPCRNGYPNQCENIEEPGVTYNGGFEPYAIVPARVCWKIDSLEQAYPEREKLFEAAALIEPSAVSYNAIFSVGGGIKPGAYCVVYGGGPIGLLCTSLLKAAGAGKIIMFELNEGRRALAKRMGADIVIDPRKYKDAAEQAAAIMEMTDGFGADFQVEAAGAPNVTMPVITKVLGVGSVCVITAWAVGDTSVYLPPFQTKKAKLCGAMGESGSGTFQNVIRLMAAGKFDPTPIVSERFALKDALAAFDCALKREAVKVIFNEIE